VDDGPYPRRSCSIDFEGPHRALTGKASFVFGEKFDLFIVEDYTGGILLLLRVVVDRKLNRGEAFFHSALIE